MPTPGPYILQEEYRPKEQTSERKKSGPIIKIISAVIVVAMLALVMFFVLVPWEDPKTTPRGTMMEYVNAFNAYDAKWLMDCSVMVFYSASDYASALSLEQPFFPALKASNAHLSMTIDSVKYSSQMAQDEMILVNASIQNNVINHGIQIVVQDSCIVYGTFTKTGGLVPQDYTTPTVLLQVNGLWYMSWAI